MSCNRDNLAERADCARKAFTNANGVPSLVAIAAQLERLRTEPDESLGSVVVRSGACMEELANGDQPGWLFDDTVTAAVAAEVCAGCLVRDECLELELRLFGGRRLGMWGALGEDGRRALHPVWVALRGGGGPDLPAGSERQHADRGALPEGGER